MSEFMCYLNSNLAREVGRLADWKEKFWGRRYQSIVVSDEEEAQISRLRYILAHGAKEGLVGSPLQWPGAHAAPALVTGDPLVGVWTVPRNTDIGCVARSPSRASLPPRRSSPSIHCRAGRICRSRSNSGGWLRWWPRLRRRLGSPWRRKALSRWERMRCEGSSRTLDRIGPRNHARVALPQSNSKISARPGGLPRRRQGGGDIGSQGPIPPGKDSSPRKRSLKRCTRYWRASAR